MILPPIGITELHVHLEGSLFPRAAIELARRLGHSWGGETEISLRRRFRYRDFGEFLETIREMCVILCSPVALRRAACELAHFQRAHGIHYAEVYVSPYIYMRWGLGYDEVIDAVTEGFSDAERDGGAQCVILLDSVRHLGVEAAAALLDAAAAYPHRSVVGFGLGGSESPALEHFAEQFEKAASLGLRRIVHSGETRNGDEIVQAIELLGVDRIAHGFRALDSPRAMDALRSTGTPLDLAVTSNYRTRVVKGEHPIRRLLDEGITVTLSTDDPSLFRTDPVREYQRAGRMGRLDAEELFLIARNGIDASFAPESRKEELRRNLAFRRESKEAWERC